MHNYFSKIMFDVVISRKEQVVWFFV
jgi:hypothetical protein